MLPHPDLFSWYFKTELRSSTELPLQSLTSFLTTCKFRITIFSLILILCQINCYYNFSMLYLCNQVPLAHSCSQIRNKSCTVLGTMVEHRTKPTGSHLLEFEAQKRLCKDHFDFYFFPALVYNLLLGSSPC